MSKPKELPQTTYAKAKRMEKKVARWATIHPYIAAYVIGLLYCGYTFSWLKGVQATHLLPNHVVATILGFSAFLIVITFFACGTLIFVWTYRKLQLATNQPRTIWLAPAIWIVCEMLISVGFSILSSGSGSRIGDYWHFGTLGMWLVPTGLVYIARWGGVYLLSYALGVLVFALIVAVRRRHWQYFVVPLVLTLLVSFSGYWVYHTPNGKKVSVTAATMKSGDDDFAPTDGLQKTLNRVKKPTDIVVLPEYSQYWQYDQPSEAKTMQHVLKDPAGLVVHSVRAKKGGENLNLVTYADANGTPLQKYQKWFIVPGGEYFPNIYKGFMYLSRNQALVKSFNNFRAITPAAQKEKPYAWQGTSYGALACSAANVPELYRDITNQGAGVLINMASLSAVGVDRLYHMQNLSQSRLHAVANARPFIQSVRGGYGYIIDSNGHILTENLNLRDGYMQATITSNNTKTLYTQLGNWPVVVALLMLVSAFVQTTKRRKAK